jgi:UDP-N-acetylmuramate dehydrogenase
MNLFDDLPADVCRRDVPLGPLTWFGLGGPAEYLIEPRNEEELAAVVRRCRENSVALRVLGFGANVLVRDEGVSGVVVRLTAEAFTNTVYDGVQITVGGGVDLAKLVRNTVRRGLAGLETLAGIPGTVGGGIRMNCGGRYGEIARAVHSVRVVSADGELYQREHDDLAFEYRRCNLGGDWVTSAEFRLRQRDSQELVRRFREIWIFKQNTQPPIGARSAGCIFRNPNGRPAGMLIDQAGLKGTRMGGAYVSERHANFILAEKGSKAADVVSLIKLVADRVETQFGIRLEPEVEIW